MKAPMEDFLATVLPRHADTGDIWGQLPPNLFCDPANFVVLRKICFKHMIKRKIFSLKMYFPQILNLASGLVLPKLCLQLGYFVLKAILSRDVA